MNFQTHRSAKQIKAIRAIGVDGTLIGLAYAAVETIWSIFIFSFFQSESTVGFISAIFSLVTLLSLMFTFPLFKKFSPQQILFSSVAANSIILAIFAHIQSPTLFIIFGIVNAFFIGIRVQSFGILLRHNSSKKQINNDENFIFVLMNVGWILGPLIAGYISNSFEIRSVMIVASAALLLSLYTITYNQSNFKKKKANLDFENKIISNTKFFFKDKKRVIAYALSGGLEIWWSIPYIFIPIVMIEQYGFNMSTVGIFLFAVVIPLIIVESIMQKKEIKNLKRVIGLGYLISGSVALIAGLCNNIYIILGAYVLGSFGIGLAEPTVHSNFFKVTKDKESEKFYGTFMTAKQVGSFVGKVLVAIILLAFKIQTSILAISILMFIFAILSLKKKKKHHKK